MARFKRRSSFSKRRSSPSSFRRARRSFGRASSSPMGMAVGGAAYGALRGYASAKLSQYVPNILGEYTDEAVMLGVSYLLATKVRNPTFRKIGQAGIVIESAMLGANLSKGVLGGVLGGTQSSNVQVTYPNLG